MEDPDRAPQVVEDLALAAFRMVKEKLGFELDFKPETLPVLDHFLLEVKGGSEEIDEKALAFVAPCAGAYFGEVLRRTLPGARWHCPADDYRAWRLETAHVFLWLNPIGAAIEAVVGQSVGDWNAHLSLLPSERPVVEESLARLGQIRAEDFYRLATRYEAFEHAASALEALAQHKGDTTRTFGPEVYAAALGETPTIEA